jgi:hypothetical protein
LGDAGAGMAPLRNAEAFGWLSLVDSADQHVDGEIAPCIR